MMSELIVTGNLAGDPILRFTAKGQPVASLRVLETRRRPDGQGGWIEDEPLALNVTAWGSLGENLAASLHKGDRVTVHGRLVPVSWEQDGETRRSVELVAEDVAASLRFAQLTGVKRTTRDERPAVSAA